MNVDVAVIGGGIAGLATALALRQRGSHSFCIFEKHPGKLPPGLAYILSADGLKAFESLGVRDELERALCPLDRFMLLDPDGTVRIDEDFRGQVCVLRSSLLEVMESLVDERNIARACQFVDFTADRDDRAVTANFADGRGVSARCFVGSDGVRSRVRHALFPRSRLAPPRVCELVAVLHEPALVRAVGRTVTKVQHPDVGLAAAVVPCGQDRLVWFMQFDRQRWPLQDTTPDAKRAFVSDRLREFCAPFPELIERTDFARSCVLMTTDLDPLPAFHRNNVVLIGDAAHAMLSFTSQGVNSALRDALALVGRLPDDMTDVQALTAAFQRYEALRRPQVTRFVDGGRELAQRFLHPETSRESATMPFVGY